MNCEYLTCLTEHVVFVFTDNSTWQQFWRYQVVPFEFPDTRYESDRLLNAEFAIALAKFTALKSYIDCQALPCQLSTWTDGRVLYNNHSCIEIFRANIEGHSILEYFDTEYKQQFYDFQRNLKNGLPLPRLHLITADREPFECEIKASIIVMPGLCWLVLSQIQL